jgi:Zn-dependent M28 family amino/carboxypeptidase
MKLGWMAGATTLLLAACASAGGEAGPPAPVPARVKSEVSALTGAVERDRLHASIEALVGFGTRHTLSDTTSETRGIGAARRWARRQFESYGAACGGCLTIEEPAKTYTADRMPNGAEIVDVLAIQKGTGDPNRVIIMSAHIDSRVSDPMNFTLDAPGANDDASGVAAVLEAARVLSRQTFDATIVYAALSGEEQGLFGGRLLAETAKAKGWKVVAVLNNDIVGNSTGISGIKAGKRVRVFSEGVRSNETPAMAAARTSTGGEIDSPSRNLARFVDDVAARHLPEAVDVDMIYRRDRFSRGGDQVPMVEAGYPAVRVTEAAENYNHQHQDLRTENGVVYGDTIDGVDFDYLANVTRLNIASLASLASAPSPPDVVKITGALSADTKVEWSATPGAASYVVWWRDTTAAHWTHSRTVAGGATTVTLTDTPIDDFAFGVSAVSASGYASPIEYAGPVGAFFPAP